MTRNETHYLAAMFVLCTLPLSLQAQNATQPPSPPAPARTATKGVPAQAPSKGEQVFAQNCSRCHTAPDGFSPHISGTIAMHMRVRASFSKQDMQELMRFLNP